MPDDLQDVIGRPFGVQQDRSKLKAEVLRVVWEPAGVVKELSDGDLAPIRDTTDKLAHRIVQRELALLNYFQDEAAVYSLLTLPMWYRSRMVAGRFCSGSAQPALPVQKPPPLRRTAT